MVETKAAGSPLSKLTGKWRPDGAGPDTSLEARVAYGLVQAPAKAQWLSNVELTHFSFIKKKDGWLVMLKGERPRMPVVAFMHGETFLEAMVTAVTALDSGHVPWKESKPPPWELA